VAALSATRSITHLPNRDGVAFQSADPGHTEAFLSAVFGTPVTISGDRDNFRYRIARLHLGSVQVSNVDQTATTDVHADPLPAQLCVFRIRRGVRTDLKHGERFGPGDIGINGEPGEQMHLQYASTCYSGIVLPMQAVAEAARNRPDDGLRPLRFDSLRPVHPAAAQRWLHTVEYVNEQLRAFPDAMTQPLLSDAITRLLAAALLTTFPNTWIAEPHHQDRTDATPATLARAIAFIDANADIEITLADIAHAACVSVRAVQLAFRRGLDTTPTAYLRRVRLERAHQQLRGASPQDGTTISQIAARWGFADPSRFTALYRRTYGQLPSQTLRT